MTSSQSEQHLLAAEIDTPETSATSTPEPFTSHQVKIPSNSRQEDAGEATSASSSLNHTSTSTNASHFAAGPKIHINDVSNSPAVGADSRRLSTIGTLRYTSSFGQNSGNFGSHRRSSLDSTQSSFDGRIDGITDHRYPRAGPSSEGIAGATKANNTDFGPPEAGSSHFSSTAANPTSVTISGPGGSARITGADPSAGSTTRGNIASRRAMRMKQALSTSSSKPTRLNEMTPVGPRPADPAMRWARWITLSSIFIGFVIAAVICWDGYRSVPKLGRICYVLDDDFSSGVINPDIWEHEVRLDGYGSGSFQWTTASSNNSYIEDGILYIVPTLTSDHLGEAAITNGYTLNLTADGTCTSKSVSQCVAVSNSSLLTVVNPVQTARLITKNAASIKYGKVEVRAKFPSGDWLWPRITMLHVNETYGAWPRSGQIDILTARGNDASYPDRGVDYAQSDLHWGPTTDLDRLYLTWGYREQRRTYYSQKYRTFGLEWNDKFMWTYIDSRISQVISLRFNKESFWTRGKFPSTYTNGSQVLKLTNPWSQSQSKVAPFDQAFYLVIDLAVGSMDGWFPDGQGGKPWTDDSLSAMSDFWAAKSKWWGTSRSSDPAVRGFAIDSVKMWRTC
ncbi:hypothetical protein I308_100628 [Cryptococcus tetragattii IND107]|uniref:GH16 domain-containing protein n=1 Tax=Cryptococcus tetragattii IND107 TaxID=1296105 RepID=A0ABR3C8M9_9TREE